MWSLWFKTRSRGKRKRRRKGGKPPADAAQTEEASFDDDTQNPHAIGDKKTRVISGKKSVDLDNFDLDELMPSDDGADDDDGNMSLTMPQMTSDSILDRVSSSSKKR